MRIAPLQARLLIFNSRDFPRRSLLATNRDDYRLLKASPDLVMEQERWFTGKWAGFGKIFSVKNGYRTFRPIKDAVSGLIFATKVFKFTHIAHFSYRGHSAVPYICSYRTYMGQVMRVGNTGRRITFVNVHPTPSAFSNRFPDGSIRKRSAQKAWHTYMNRVRAFTENQLKAGRDYLIIGGDFNAHEDKLREIFGTTFAGRQVQYVTSSATKIDHFIVFGDIRIIQDRLVTGTTSDHKALYIDVEFN